MNKKKLFKMKLARNENLLETNLDRILMMRS